MRMSILTWARRLLLYLQNNWADCGMGFSLQPPSGGFPAGGFPGKCTVSTRFPLSPCFRAATVKEPLSIIKWANRPVLNETAPLVGTASCRRMPTSATVAHVGLLSPQGEIR
jgi:hypothetical protein